MKLVRPRGLVLPFIRARAAIFRVGLATVISATGCGEVGAPGSGLDVEDGALRGELAGYTADYPDGHSETHYTLRAPSGVEKALVFDHQVDLTPGTEIKVWGTDSPEGLRVRSFRAVSLTPEETRRSALVNGSVYAPRSFAFVLVNLSNQGFKPAITETDVLARMINNADSIRNYYIDDSYARQDITTQVFGPINYTLNGCGTSSNTGGPGQLAADLRSMIPGTFQHYLWYFGTDQRAAGCSWQGLASLGTPDKPSKDTWYNASTNCVVLVQEPGHNFGMQHSSSMACPGASFLDNPNGCTADEYGDVFDPMGQACRHMNAWQKAYQGWFGGCNGVSVTQSGVFTLLPLESRCDGAQFLKVKAAKARTFNRPADGGGGATTESLGYYYVELRTPTDFDATLGGNRSSLSPQILIHVADEVHTRTQKGVHTFLLDMAPSTKSFSDAALPVGQTFTDPMGGVSITATAVSATQATITVTVEGGTGAPTCLDGTAFAVPGPGPESCGAGGGLMGAGGATGTASGGVPGGAGGRAASGGAGGRASTGGTTGTGSGGAPASGSGGRASTGGASATGTGGASATGSGGMLEPGSGGASGTGGTGGAIIAGTGGSETRPGAGSGGKAPSETPTVVGGCNCTTASSGSTSWPSSGVTLGSGALALLASARRRRRR